MLPNNDRSDSMQREMIFRIIVVFGAVVLLAYLTLH
jgi:hypothetical protein